MATKRQLNFELLRIYCMFFIVLGHLQGHLRTPLVNDGGMFASAINAFTGSLGIGSVDMFVMISGYFLISAKGNLLRPLKIYVETLFYLVFFSFIFYLCGKANTIDLVKSFFPLAPTKYAYWFVTKYIALVLLQPFLSRTIVNISKRQYQILLGILMVINCEFVTGFPLGEVYSGSFHFMWFVCLFFIGGYIRLFCKPLENRSKLKVFFLLLLSLLVYSCCAMFCNGYIKLGYNSLLTVSISVCIFRLVQSWSIHNSRVISFIAPNVFAVYIIHQHHLVREFFNEWLPEFLPISTSMQGFYIITLVVCVFFLCVVIDKCRVYLFTKIGINDCLANLANRVEKTMTFDCRV